MTFSQKLEPKSGYSSNLTGVAMAIVKAGDYTRVRIVIREDVIDKMNFIKGEKVDIFIGDGDDKGKILIKKGTGFSLQSHTKKIFRVEMVPWGDLPKDPTTTAEAEFKIGSDGLIVTIPDFKPKKKK